MGRGWMLGAALGIAAATAASASLAQQSGGIIGRWLSQSGDGIIDIYHCGDRLCGKLVWLREPVRDGRPVTDARNPDAALKARPVCGLVMLGDFKPDGANAWDDGWIYSPENGKTYSASMKLESPTVLKLRGYVGISLFGETQTWTRADPKVENCKAN